VWWNTIMVGLPVLAIAPLAEAAFHSAHSMILNGFGDGIAEVIG
jgi:hypothetical protein